MSNLEFGVQMLIDLGPVWECFPPCFSASLYIFQPNRSSSSNFATEKRWSKKYEVGRAPKKELPVFF